MPDLLIGVLAALGAAALYAVAMGLQALEARVESRERALRFSLLWRLVRRPRWLLGTALGLAGWLAQAYALTRAPLTLVQPLLGTSLVFLLAIARRRLGERVGRRECLAVLAVAAGVPLLALTAPGRDPGHAEGARLWVVLGVLAAVSLAPLTLRGAARSASVLVPLGAGLAYSLDGLATKFASDEYSRGLWLGLGFWALVMGAASGLGTLGEMSALQRRPVAHVAPIVFALTTFVPVALAPLLAREWWPASALRDAGLAVGLVATGIGALALARAAPVGRVLAPEARSSERGTARMPRRSSDDASVATARLR
jgi:drug/metabolite transporter (DMT)-like permease